MNLHQISLDSGKKLCLVDKFLPPELSTDVQELFDTFCVDNRLWVPDPGVTDVIQRYRYDHDLHPTVVAVNDYLKSSYIIDLLSNIANKKLELANFKFWVDKKLLLAPHKEANGDVGIAQIYFTKTEHPFLGTTIYQDNKQLLFQLPFRNNFGWFFPESDTVMHGKLEQTPADFNRCSLMIFFK